MRKFFLRKEFLYKEYVVNGKSIRDIAKVYRCSPMTVWRRLREFGIPTRSLEEATELRRDRHLRRKKLPEPKTYRGTYDSHLDERFEELIEDLLKEREAGR